MRNTEDRRQKIGAAGFSLMEVLFAVLVLTMGMMFVAVQFPVGMLNARHVRDTTVNLVESHNASVMLELQLRAKYKSGGSAGLGKTIVTGDSNIHLLVKPNVWVEAFPPKLVVYDPEEIVLEGTSPEPLFWSHQPPLEDPFVAFTEDYVGDIGAVVLPAVGETDQAVVDYLLSLGIDPQVATEVQWNEAMFEVALSKRRYSWSALYRCLDKGAGARTYRFYTFTLRAGISEARYAMQDDADNGIVFPIAPSDDRRFPVAWRINLNDPGFGLVDEGFTERNYIGSGSSDTNTNPANLIPDRFPLTPELVDILQPGSILIDADIERSGTNWQDNGYVYEVQEVVEGPNGFELRLRQRLQDDLNFVWVFPPAIERDASGFFLGFADQQPVVKVSEKVVRF